MNFVSAILIAITLGMLLPSQAYSSSNERARTPPRTAKVQRVEVYRLVYIVDEQGHMVLVRHDNALVRQGAKVSR